MTSDDMKRVQDALLATEKMLSRFLDERTSSATALAVLNVKLEKVEDQLGEVLTVVRGSEGLQTRTQALSSEIAALAERMKRIEGAAQQTTAGRWAVAAALASGLAGLAGSVAQYLIGR